MLQSLKGELKRSLKGHTFLVDFANVPEATKNLGMRHKA